MSLYSKPSSQPTVEIIIDTEPPTQPTIEIIIDTEPPTQPTATSLNSDAPSSSQPLRWSLTELILMVVAPPTLLFSLIVYFVVTHAHDLQKMLFA
ncbi:hypothetical protein M5689_016156 [Euphorbia peplus]|nr:hypothetical protein M5689_016156 [Euphorbia peplus]